MSDYAEIWRFWYDAQMSEQSSNQLRFSNEKPTIRAASPFDPAEDAQVLRKAMKGMGTNEDDIINILTARNADQRLQIQDKYQQLHGRNLVKDLKSELNGIFEKVILSLLKPMSLFLAEQVKEATKGAGTDETALIEIFCTRDDDSIKTIKETFENMYDTSIEKVICKETTGEFEKILMSILSMCRDDSASSPSDVADELCAEGVDEDTIRRIVTSFTFPFLKKMFNSYETKTGEEFKDLVEKKCSGDSKRAFNAIYLSANSRPEFYAHALHEAMKGCGTDDWALIRIVVSRCEIDLHTIKAKYADIFEKDLVVQIKEEISGDYEKTLVKLLGGE